MKRVKPLILKALKQIYNFLNLQEYDTLNSNYTASLSYTISNLNGQTIAQKSCSIMLKRGDGASVVTAHLELINLVHQLIYKLKEIEN